MDFRLWPNTLGRIASAFGAPSASMARQGRAPPNAGGTTVGVDPTAAENYIKYYYGLDLLWQSVMSMPVGTVKTDTMVVPRRELVRTEFFNDFLVPQSVYGLLNAVVLVEDGRQGIVTLYRDRQFDDGHVALYKLLAPHMQQAAQINIKLARAELNHIASVETLNHLDERVLFVDLDAKIMFANKAAEKFFADRDLRQNQGRLAANLSAQTATLHAVIAKCA